MAPTCYHLFAALKQKLGCHRFKGDCVVKIIMADNVHDTKFYQQGTGMFHNMTNG